MSARDRLDDERRLTTQRLAALRGDYRGFVEASKDTNADVERWAETGLGFAATLPPR